MDKSKTSLEKWDREIAPKLGVIQIKCGQIRSALIDINHQIDVIKSSMDEIDTFPNFETEAVAQVYEMRDSLAAAAANLDESIWSYQARMTELNIANGSTSKEKVV